MSRRPKKRTRGPNRVKPAEKPPTDRQNDYLAAVAHLTRKLGDAPNATEVAAHMGVSRHAARQVLKHLEKAGYLRDVPKEVSSGKWALTPAGVVRDSGE